MLFEAGRSSGLRGMCLMVVDDRGNRSFMWIMSGQERIPHPTTDAPSSFMAYGLRSNSTFPDRIQTSRVLRAVCVLSAAMACNSFVAVQ